MFKVGFVALLAVCGSLLVNADNLLGNPGFEQPMGVAWEKRTPDDSARKIYLDPTGGRSGAGVVIENLKPAFTRIRQGQEKNLCIKADTLIEFSAWIRTEMEASGKTTLQLFFIGAEGNTVAQPLSPKRIFGSCEWQQLAMRVVVPHGTEYIMPYLQTQGGKGKVWFDDTELKILRHPPERTPARRIAFLTDLPVENATRKLAEILFEDGLYQPEQLGLQGLQGATGLLVLYAGQMPDGVMSLVRAYAEQGGRVFMDIRAFAQGYKVTPVSVRVGTVKSTHSFQARMEAGLRVVAPGDGVAGFKPGQIMPRAGWPDGELQLLPANFSVPEVEVLAVGPGEEPGVVQIRNNQGGLITACDLLSLREPLYRYVDAYYAFTPVSGALGNPVRYGEYYPRRFKYSELVVEMKAVAAAFPDKIKLIAEGEASDGQMIYTLNLGNSGKPFYFIYAAAHGLEWEPGYGLLTLARHLANGKMSDVVDLERVSVKLLPILNPWGYDNFKRQNANGVDLNRQGDQSWEQYKGSDTNNDGVYGPFDIAWKGTAPFVEPEAKIYKRIISDPLLYCLLDFHGNVSARGNKVGFYAYGAAPKNEERAFELQAIVNWNLRGRHLLQQINEDSPSQYLLDRMKPDGSAPMLQNTGARGRYGLLIELPAIYRETYGTVLQSDVTCEVCRALFEAYPIE